MRGAMELDNLSGAHTRFNAQYHFVWIVKYRRDLLYDLERQKVLKELVGEISDRFEFVIVQMGTDGNHVHLFLRAAPRWSPADIMQKVKGLTAREMLRRLPSLRQLLWSAHLWADGYYVGTVGDGVTADIIKKYIENQGKDTGHKNFSQLRLF